MKNLLISALALASAFLMSTPVYATPYPSAGVVVETHDNHVTYVEQNGNVWECNTHTNDWMIGDVIAVIREDNGTPIVYDDYEVNTRYVGYVDEVTLEKVSDYYSEFILDIVTQRGAQ